MNPLETAIDTSKRKLENLMMSSGVSSHYNSSALNRNSLNQPSLHTDRAMIKYVIGASANEHQESILKKSASNQIITSTAAPATIKRSNSVAKSVNWTEATATSVKFRQTKIPAQNEVKQQVAGAKLPTIKNLHGISEKAAIIQRPLNIRRPPKQLIRPHGMQTATTTHGHTVYKTNNGYSSYPEMITSSLMPGASELIGRKLPTIKGVSRPNMSRLEMNPINVSGSRINPVASTTDVTQITSTVTLTKAPTTAGKQNKSLQSPLVTIEKKGNNQTSNLLNSSKAGKITFPNSAEAMDIVVNTIGGNKIISLGSDSDEPVIVLDSPQKSLLKQSPPPTSTEKTPLKPQLPKAKQQSLLKINSMVRLLQTSPRTKRSKSLTAINAGKATKRRHHPAKGRRISTYSESEITLQKTKNLLAAASAAVKEKTITPPTKITEASLFCTERIETIPISSSSNSSRNSSLEICTKKEITPVNKTTTPYQFNTVLEMLSSFNMLNWKDRIGSSKDGKMKYQLNDFNLLQVAEACPTRNNIYTAYEKPIAERESLQTSSAHSDPMYLCTRCGSHGLASDFLAPGFCSLECYRRDYRKRPKTNISYLERIVKNRFIKKPKKCSDSVDDLIEISAGTRQGQFSWPSYLYSTKSEAAPIDLFLNPFPCEANLFEVGMKLEAIDPEHNSLFCVCTVVEKKGYRLQLKFDGYSKMHNFWVNADSMDIFPPGWCAKTNRVLQPPKGMNLLTFNWPTYLTRTKSPPAPRNLFTHLNSSSTTNPFKVGMRLEADDLKNTGKVCVATVADVLDNRILIHFDGWDERYDYWIDINSPYIHPINWHEEESLELVPPPDWDESFSWPEYLEFTRTKPAQPRIFSRRFPIEFYTGMKLEVVDVKSPSLIRPATVLCRSEYKILLHLDGWPSKLSFWVNDDSTDIHPIGWCEETGHDLEPPPGFTRASHTMPCPVKGCCGLGNAKRIDIHFHATEDYCPYVPWNWETELEKPSRLDEPGRFGEVKEVPTIACKSTTDMNFAETVTANQAVENIGIKPQLAAIQMKELKPTLTSTAESTKTQLFQPSTDDIKIAREFLCDYGPRLKQNYMIWQGNSNFNPDIIKKNPLKWTTKETAEYITTKCHPIGYILLREDIDGLALLSMQQSDLTDILKIKLGPAMKIFSHIMHLRNYVVSRFRVDTKPLTDN